VMPAEVRRGAVGAGLVYSSSSVRRTEGSAVGERSITRVSRLMRFMEMASQSALDLYSMQFFVLGGGRDKSLHYVLTKGRRWCRGGNRNA